jgi:sulfonate transport system permease protein
MKRLHTSLSMLAGTGGSLLVLGAFIALWWVASTSGWVNRAFLPSPQATLESLRLGLLDGDLVAHTSATLGRMVGGWVLASALGIVLGALIGSSARAREWIAPTLEFVRPLPASAVIPLAIALFGLSGHMVLTVVALGALWPVLLATLHGLAQVHPQLREVSRSLQLSRLAYLLKVGLPNALPDILAGMRLSLTVALIVSVVGEMIASQPGLGQTILLAARSFQASDLYAGVALLGALGLASNAALGLCELRLLRWQRP